MLSSILFIAMNSELVYAMNYISLKVIIILQAILVWYFTTKRSSGNKVIKAFAVAIVLNYLAMQLAIPNF